MSFNRGRGRGIGRDGGSSGRGFGGGGNRNYGPRGGGGGSFGRGGNKNFRGGRSQFDQGPPERIIPLGNFSYTCQNDLVCKVDIEDVPYFNAPIFLENKEQIGKIDEIFGTIKDYSVSIKLSENIKASSFKANQKLFIDPGKLLPFSRFLPKPPPPKGAKKKRSSNSGAGVTKDFKKGGGFRGGRGGGGRGGNFFKKHGSGGRGGRDRW